MSPTLNVLSLFAGIGGLDLGLERAGMRVVGQVEIDPYCRQVLAKHWPEVPRHDDVRTAVEWWRGVCRLYRSQVDVVAGGFPCQPISQAGRRLVQEDPRWLWPAMAAVIRALRPRYALLENVADLTARGMGDVLGDLAAGGYDADWDCIPASAVGAPHRRERVFIVAHANGKTRSLAATVFGRASGPALLPAAQAGSRRRDGIDHAWSVEPDVGRVAHGVPARLDRLRALGNAVVPQVAEYVGRLIIEHAAGVAA